MKKRRKHKSCLNCGELLHPKHNYCPHCGQENTDNQVSIGLLLREVTANFFSLDSRFARTFKPFLFSPGKITNAFNGGKRVRYANPIRWYLVISIFHFFFMSKMFQPTVKDRQENIFSNGDIELDSASFIDLNYEPDTSTAFPFSNSQQKLVNHLVNHSTLTDDEIYDTLKLERSWLSAFATKKLIRTSRDSTASLNGYLLRQIPIIVFFILPLYAFYLKLFFGRRGLYIKHLIHSIHLHSFFFFIMGWVWVVSLVIESFQDIGGFIALGLTSIYAVISFMKVYQTKFLKSLFKLGFIGFFYLITLGFVLLVGVLISFVFY